MKNRRTFLLSLVVLTFLISGFISQPKKPNNNFAYQTDSGISPTIKWLTFVGTDKWDYSFSTVGDGRNIYALLNSYESDNGSFNPSKDNNQPSIVKINNSGKVEWNSPLNSEPHSWGIDLALDPTGSIYVGGISNDTWGKPVALFTKVAQSVASKNMFVAKYDDHGVLIWNTFLGSRVNDLSSVIAADKNGDSYIAWAQDNEDETNRFTLAKLNGDGELQWSRIFVQSNNPSDGYSDGPNDIKLDDQGNIYVLNNSSSTWGKPIRDASGNLDASIAKFDNNGESLWNTFLGGTGVDYAQSIAIGADGSIYVAGSSEVEWGAPLASLQGNSDGFIAKLNPDGVLLWNTFLGGVTGDDNILNLAIDITGKLYLAGYSDSSWGVPFNEIAGNGDGFIAQMDSNGNLVWSTFMGGNGSENIEWVGFDGSNNIQMVGSSNSSFGNPINTPPGGGNDVFVAEISLANETKIFREIGPLVPELTVHIPTPLDISTEPAVIGMNILLAVFLMLPFAVAVDYFSKIISDNDEILQKRFPLIAWLNKLQNGSRGWISQNAKQNQTLMDVLSLVGVAVFYGVVFSLLDQTWKPFTPSGLVLLGSMTLAYGLIGIVDDILQWRAVRKWGIPSEYNVHPTNLFLSAVSVGISRILTLLPGLMFGSPEAVKFDESLLSEKQNQSLMRISINTYLFLTFGAWLPTIVTTLVQRGQASDTVKTLVGGLEAFLLVIFAVGIENMFIQLLGFSESLGKKLKKSNQWTWVVSLALCSFVFLHTLLNPHNSFVSDLQKGNTTVFIGVAVTFILIVFVIWFISWMRKRKVSKITTQPEERSTHNE